ncbi:MAG: hypothetical protein GX644_15750 [Limnobacter sp.]|nr:hypothetical protein [Limnobacter sp.]
MFAAASAFAFAEIIDAAATAAMAAARAGRDAPRRVVNASEAGLWLDALPRLPLEAIAGSRVTAAAGSLTAAELVVAAASLATSTALPGTSAVSVDAEALVWGFIALSSWSVEKALPT